MVDAGEVVVRISADISALQTGMKQVVSELNNLKTRVDQISKSTGRMSGTLSGIQGQIQGATNGLASFLGYAISIYGALNLWKSAIEGWYTLIKTGIDAVNDYRMAVISASGLMTSISDVKPPELEKAYGAWRKYFDWLYHESLATDKLVAASGREIFEAGMELAMRGLVPKTGQQVYITGLLVDMVKSVTKGLSEKQQLWQEIRSLFEGKVRLGAQLLQKFQQVDPQFLSNLDAARNKAMKMGDAVPVWELLEKVLKGMSYASNDMQNTMDSLVNTTKAGFQLLMIEAFGPAYDSIVKMGWGLLEVFYNQGYLTEQGQLLANILSQAWGNVESSVESYVNYIKDNPQVVVDIVNKMVNALTSAAQGAMAVAKAIVSIANEINALDITKLISLAAILGGIRTGGITGFAIAAAGAAGLAYSDITGQIKTKEQGLEALKNTEDKIKHLEVIGQGGSELRAKLEEGAKNLRYATEHWEENADRSAKAIGASIRTLDSYAVQYSQANKAYVVDFSTYQATSTKLLTQAVNTADKAGKDLQARMNAVRPVYQKLLQDAKGNLGKTAAITKAMEDLERRNYGMAPETPGVKMQPPSPAKGGKGGRDSRFFDLQKQYNTLLLKDMLSETEALYKSLLDKDETYRTQLKIQLDEGVITYKDYYAKLGELADNEKDRDVKLMEEKKRAIEATTKANIEAIKENEAMGKLFPEEADEQIKIEIEKRLHELKMADFEIQKILEKYGREKIKRLHEELDLYKKISDETKQQALDVEAAWGSPLAERRSASNKILDEYKKETQNMTPGSAEFIKKTEMMKMKQAQLLYGQQVKELTNAVTNGIQGLVDGIIEGRVDLEKLSQSFFKDMVHTALMPLFDALKDIFTNFFKSILGSATGMGGGSAGGFFSFLLPQMATGGIVTSAMPAIVGESGAEAIIPLEKLHEYTGQGIALNVNVINNTRQPVQASSRKTEDGIDLVLDEAVAGVLERGGKTSKTLTSLFNTSSRLNKR